MGLQFLEKFNGNLSRTLEELGIYPSEEVITAISMAIEADEFNHRKAEGAKIDKAVKEMAAKLIDERLDTMKTLNGRLIELVRGQNLQFFVGYVPFEGVELTQDEIAYLDDAMDNFEDCLLDPLEEMFINFIENDKKVSKDLLDTYVDTLFKEETDNIVSQ